MPKATAKTKHIAELIELLLTEPINPDNVKGNPVLPMDLKEPIGFAEKFSSLLYETPNIGSTSKKEFFIHGVLGSVLTLPDSGLMEKLGINKVYVKHTMRTEQGSDGKVEVVSDVVKLCFSFEKDGKKQIALRVFANDEVTGDGNPGDKYRYSDDELKEIAKKLDISNIDNINVDEHVFRISTEGDSDNKSFRLHKEQTGGVKQKFKAAASSQSQINNEFEEVSVAQSTNFEDSFKKLSDEDIKEAIGGTEEIFKEFANTYQDNQKKLSLFNLEAAYHGFHYGALALNFKYRYGLNCYVERTAGNGRADLIFMSRTKDANGRMNPKPIPVIVEFKGEGHTADEAIAQIKNKGYLYNLSIRTKAEDAVIAGVAKNGRLKVDQGRIFQSRGFIHQILEEANRFNQNRIDEIKDILKGELKNLYHSIHSKNQHYLSKLVLGQILAADESLDKHVFQYEDSGVGEEVTTFVLFNQDEDKAVILNIIEHSGEQVTLRGRKRYDSNKIPLIDKLGINSAVKIDVTISTGVEHKPDVFEVEEKDKSYYQDIKIEGISNINSKDKYQGDFQKIENVDIGDLIRGLQESNIKESRTRGDKKRSDKKLRESLSPLAEALSPFKGLIKKEVDFQAIMQGLFINGKTEDGKEIRVYTESNLSPRGRMDLGLSFTQLSESDGSFTENDPVIIELKHADSKSGASRKLKQAEEQMGDKYEILRSFTDKKTANYLAIVLNTAAINEKDMILASMRAVDVYHTTSGSSPERSPGKKRPGSLLAGCSKRRKTRDTGVSCIDSRDEESIEEQERKEKVIKELFDTDEIRKRIENIRLYNRLFEVSKQISKGETIDPHIEGELIAKSKKIDLSSIDPEIKDIVKEIKEKTSEEKEEIRNILTRPGVTEKVRKVAEGAGHALAVCFVAQHVVNGDIEGLGYDALNLLVLPKVGQAVSGKLLELGVKYNSQALRGLAPVVGSVIGNFLAYLGLVGSIKALQDATDPIDRKIAELNIATNSIFIAADMPAVVTGIMSSAGASTGMVGELAGPAGAAAAVVVIIASRFIEAELKVERLEELVKLTSQERHQLYWDFFLSIPIPEYIERDIEAKKIYEDYISKIISNFKDNFGTIAVSWPRITLEEKEYIKVEDVSVAIRGIGGPSEECKIQKEKINLKLDFPPDTKLGLSSICDAISYSRVIPEKIQSYDILCGPTDQDIQVEVSEREEYKDPSFESCSGYFKDHHNGKATREWKKWFLRQYPPNCNNTVVYNEKGSNKHKSLYYIKSQSTQIRTYGDSEITVVFDGNDISVISTKRKGDVIYSRENRCHFSQPLKKREDHILSGNVFTPEIGEVHKSGSNFFSTGNRYYFSQPLKSCKVDKPGNNFFYIKGDNFSCNLGEEGQKNTVVVQGNFTDSGNKNIHAIIGSNTTNFFEVFRTGYVDGQGGSDIIIAKNFTTVMGHFGDNIYGKSLVLLPMALHDISKMIHEGDKKTIYSEDGELTIHGKEILMKTRDDFFVTATKTDNRTKMVTNLHIVNYNGTEVLEAHDDCVSGNGRIQESILYAFEELAFREGSKNVGFHFMHKLFNGTHLHKNASGFVFVDRIPFIIMLALKGKFPSNPNFKTTRQMFSKKLDVVIGDSSHHVFYADKQSHFFYWEGAKNVPNLYLFDGKNVTVIINKGNGLLDFSVVKSEEKYKVEVEEDAVFIVNSDVNVVLPLNYENVTITYDGKRYYKLLGNGGLEREHCSHSLKIGGKFRVNGTDLLNYNCLIFDTGKVFFLRLGNDLLLVSDKEALSILDYYKPDSDVSRTNDLSHIMRVGKFADSLDLSIKLSNRIIKPEEFRKRANNPSVFRYYQLGEEGLEIYHNQPTNNHRIGLMDLKDKSILDCSVKITSGNLILSFKDKAIVQVENWNIYQPARDMMFAFNDTVISNAKCVVSNCDPKDIVEEFKKEKAKLANKNGADVNAENSRGNAPLGADNLVLDIFFSEERRNEESTRRHRRHHIRHEHKHRGHRNHRSPIKEVTSSAARSSSWINVFANTIEDAVRSVSQFISSLFKPAIDMEPSRAITIQGTDVNNTLLLLDVLIRKITGQKYVSTADQPIPLLEARGYALNITTEFERVLKDTAKRSGVSVNKLSFDSLEVYKAIEGKMISGELSKISTILYSAIEEAYPKNEKFLSILKGNIERMLDRQKVVNCVRSSNQVPNIVGVSDKIPLSSLNNIAIEPVNGKKGVTFAGRVG